MIEKAAMGTWSSMTLSAKGKYNHVFACTSNATDTFWESSVCWAPFKGEQDRWGFYSHELNNNELMWYWWEKVAISSWVKDYLRWSHLYLETSRRKSNCKVSKMGTNLEFGKRRCGWDLVNGEVKEGDEKGGPHGDQMGTVCVSWWRARMTLNEKGSYQKSWVIKSSDSISIFQRPIWLLCGKWLMQGKHGNKKTS